VSLREVDALVAAQEITPVRLLEKLVRFYLPDVMRELRERSADVEEKGDEGGANSSRSDT
jgi:hypothetical protein